MGTSLENRSTKPAEAGLGGDKDLARAARPMRASESWSGILSW